MRYDKRFNHELHLHRTRDSWYLRLRIPLFVFFFWSNTKDWSYELKCLFICVSLFLLSEHRMRQKSHSVNMCIIIHSSGRIVCLLWPHFQRPQKQATGVGSSKQRPFFPTRLGLRNAHHSAGTEPFTGLLAAHEWQMNPEEPFPSTGAAVTTL